MPTPANPCESLPDWLLGFDTPQSAQHTKSARAPWMRRIGGSHGLHELEAIAEGVEDVGSAVTVDLVDVGGF